jgi:hypothetical protein
MFRRAFAFRLARASVKLNNPLDDSKQRRMAGGQDKARCARLARGLYRLANFQCVRLDHNVQAHWLFGARL